MKIFWLGAAIAAVNGQNTETVVKDKGYKDIRDIKKDAFLKDLAKEVTDELKNHMQLEGLNMGRYMDEAIGVYRSDFPQKDARMGVIAQSIYQFEQGGGISRMEASGLTLFDKIHIMKYMQLKFTTLFLQKQKFLGKFCFYGCWCFPRAAGSEYSGYGVPVDNIDKSCREYTTCFNCIYNLKLIGQRCDENNAERYNIGGSQDAQTGKVSLFCKDPHGTCLRSRCECDLDLALKLQAHESEWNANNHHKWGTPPFNPQAVCGVNVNQFLLDDPDQQKQLNTAVIQQIHPELLVAIADKETELEAMKQAKQQSMVSSQLVGSLSSSRPNVMKSPKPASAPIYGPIIGCCGRAPKVHFFRQGQRCCLDGEIVDERAPCSMDFA